ncbi:succinate dehydrogenase cytochrome b subunit [uncultured Chryseobacterium sp.]|uniref:succinate dehydrogenase cytochrome b subunit n=1 Tax=uncultured Chryseobacterium sp. TaxID=259322 RepID=UPI0025DFF374|nr:succinate dehydrogenase cytochrome b subunit [uncultured Chryseobacterium sp.]
MAGLTSSTIGRKYAMALSAIFLLIFLIMHLTVNFLSVFGADAYNNASEFMGYNPLIQFVMQPVLIAAVIFHFVMGFVLEIKNQKARPIKYESNNPSNNSTWMSRNMIISGAVVLAFIFLHMYDFWFHEMNYKYIDGLPVEESRFWGDLHAKFEDAWRVIIYVISFILLGLHLGHGFQSSFQSIGARHPKYTPVIMAFGKWYSILIPAGFIFIAIFHFVTQ